MASQWQLEFHHLFWESKNVQSMTDGLKAKSQDLQQYSKEIQDLTIKRHEDHLVT